MSETIGNIGDKNVKVGRGGVYTNMDVDLTHSERTHIENEIEMTEAIAEQMKEGSIYTGQWDPSRDALRVAREQMENTPKTFRERRHKLEPVIPVAHFFDNHGELRWVLNDDDAAAAADGQICENCLNYQASTIEIKCNPIHGISCGYTRKAF